MLTMMLNNPYKSLCFPTPMAPYGSFTPWPCWWFINQLTNPPVPHQFVHPVLLQPQEVIADAGMARVVGGGGTMDVAPGAPVCWFMKLLSGFINPINCTVQRCFFCIKHIIGGINQLSYVNLYKHGQSLVVHKKNIFCWLWFFSIAEN